MDKLLAVRNPEKELSYEDLQMLTNNFSRENLISRTQFGPVYRGEIPVGWKGMKAQGVTVKLWETAVVHRGTQFYHESPEQLRDRFATEINFLSLPIMESHPNLAKVMGYCFEGNHLGVVYDLNPLKSIRSLVAKGSLNWFHRMKVAYSLAHLLQFLHGQRPQYLLRNLCAAHIMLDQDYNPALIDCAMVVGGGFGDTSKAGSGCPLGTYGYVDAYPLSTTGEWSEKSDIFSFGVILLELISKCTFDWLPLKNCQNYGSIFFYDAARYYYLSEKSKFGSGEFKLSLVRKALSEEPDFHACDGPKITRLAVQCTDMYPDPRPTAKEVVEELEKLHCVRKNGWKQGSPKMLDAGSKHCCDDSCEVDPVENPSDPPSTSMVSII